LTGVKYGTGSMETALAEWDLARCYHLQNKEQEAKKILGPARTKLFGMGNRIRSLKERLIYYQNLLANCEQLMGKKDPNLFNIIIAVSDTKLMLNDYDGCISVFKSALSDLGDTENDLTADLLGALAMTYMNTKHFEDAKPVLEREINVRERISKGGDCDKGL